jgi:hypothetical protein
MAFLSAEDEFPQEPLDGTAGGANGHAGEYDPADDVRIRSVAEARPLAAAWVDNALRSLSQLRRALETHTELTPLNRLVLDAARRHFHTDRRNSEVTEADALRSVETNFHLIRQSLATSDSIFDHADDETAARNTRGYFGSEFTVPAYAYSRKAVAFTADFPTLGLNCRAAVVVHQLTHFIDQRIRDIAGTRGQLYDGLDFETARLNVHCYPNFAINVTPPYRDERFGMTRPDV